MDTETIKGIILEYPFNPSQERPRLLSDRTDEEKMRRHASENVRLLKRVEEDCRHILKKCPKEVSRIRGRSYSNEALTAVSASN